MNKGNACFQACIKTVEKNLESIVLLLNRMYMTYDHLDNQLLQSINQLLQSIMHHADHMWESDIG
jgi:hypothetical protein